VIKKQGSRYVLRSIKTGKKLGTHPSRKAALAQERAIQIAKQIRKKRG
jgi:hypothetical protein